MSGITFIKILKCSNCSVLIEEISGGLHDVMAFGSSSQKGLKWSDGKKYITFSSLLSSMHSICFSNPNIIKCYNCKEVLWRTDLEEIVKYSSYTFYRDENILKSAKKYITPTYIDYIQFAENTTKKEYIKHCRIEAWHMDNEKRRNKNKLYIPLEKKEINNLLKLLEILSDKNDCLLKVEIYRELGDFDKSLEILINNYSKNEENYELFYILNILKIKELIVYGDKSISLK